MINSKAKFLFILILLSFVNIERISAQIIKDTRFKVFKDLKVDSGDLNKKEISHSKSKKGGKITIGCFGTFDTLNALTYSGIPAAGLSKIGDKVISDDIVYNHLMRRSSENSGVLEPQLAESVEYSDDYSWIIYNLNKDAKWENGTPITSEDVKFSWETLKEHGRSYLQSYYKRVEKVEILSPYKIKFYFKPIELDNNIKLYDRMLIGLVSVMAILPKYYLEGKDFVKLNLEIAPLSGPYKISKVDPGRLIVYERNKDFWGKDLEVNKDLYNFDTVVFEYYRDQNSMFEALKKGRFDIFMENNIKRWRNGYNFLKTKSGLKYKKIEFEHNLPVGMNAIALNTRVEKFKDIRIRKALNLMFDFDWLNKNLFYSSYKRSKSFFQNSDFMHGDKISDKELEIMKQLPNPVALDDLLLKDISESMVNKRSKIKKAIELFNNAGWHIKRGVMVNKSTGKPFEFDMWLYNNALKPVALHYASDLRRIGVRMNIRMLDESVYWRKVYNHKHEVIIFNWSGYEMPSGSMLMTRWGRDTYARGGNLNFSGFNDINIDFLCKKAQLANDYQEYRDSLKVLDRVLLSKMNIIPLFYSTKIRMVINKDLVLPDIGKTNNKLSFVYFYYKK